MENKLGLIHVYTGDGRGKTSCAMGTALRALGRGYKVVIVQFLKGGESGEIMALEKMDNVTIFRSKPTTKFTFQMNEQELAQSKVMHNENFNEAVALCYDEDINVLVLDEIISTFNMELIDRQKVLDFLNNKPKNLEVIMTGRSAPEQLTDLSHYVSVISSQKHPYEVGIGARIGIDK